MGRFDALTQLEKNPVTPPSIADETIPDQFASKEANQHTSKEVNPQGSNPTNQQTTIPASVQTSKPAKKQTNLPANQQTSKTLKKFGSYLTEGSIRRLKRIAFETDRKDYEVLQEAVDEFLQRVK